MFIPMNELKKMAKRIEKVLNDCHIPCTTFHILSYLDLYGMLRFNNKTPVHNCNTANWVQITLGQTPEIYMCSLCGRRVYHDGIREAVVIHYPYCHCGAKMEVNIK